MCRFGWSVFCVFVLVAVPCLARTWTDRQGNTVQGELVRVLKGRVIVSVGGRVVQIPFGHLIDDDQEFVREQLEARGQGSFLSARKKAIKSDSAEPGAAEDAGLTAGPERTWTDVAGRKVQARFLDVDNAKVVLQLHGKRSSFPFEKFSLEDQQYVRTEMKTRGQEEKVPTISPPDNPPPGPAVPQVAQSLPPPSAPCHSEAGPAQNHVSGGQASGANPTDDNNSALRSASCVTTNRPRPAANDAYAGTARLSVVRHADEPENLP